MADALRILLVDDSREVRSLLSQLLVMAGMVVVGEAGSRAEAEEMCLAHSPDAAVVDYSLPGGGPATARSLLALQPSLSIVGLSAQNASGARHEMLSAGAHSYLLKGDDIGHLTDAIRAACSH